MGAHSTTRPSSVSSSSSLLSASFSAFGVTTSCQAFSVYGKTSIIRNRHPLGPYRRTMPRILGRGAISYERGSPVGRCRANVAHTRQSTPDPGLDFQVNVLTTFEVDASSLLSASFSSFGATTSGEEFMDLCFSFRFGKLQSVEGLGTEIEGDNLALTVGHVPHSLASGIGGTSGCLTPVDKL